MNISYSRSMLVAQNVLNAVMMLNEDDGLCACSDRAYIGAYQNGREDGYSLSFYNRVPKHQNFSAFFCFSEHRISDDIVVYYSKLDPMQCITDEMYANARSFPCGAYDEAAKFIVESVVELFTADLQLATANQ